MSEFAQSRRRFMQTGGALALSAWAPAVVRAQGAPLQLGVLTPLTGAGGFDGPRMAKAMQAVIDEVNGAGGLLGRKVVLVIEDDQTNPEAAVRAARKLIDVTKVPAIMGTWASAVTTAVAPLCWESRTFLTTVSGADSITKLPHQGYLIRTQPNNHLQAGKHAEFIASLGAKRVYMMSIQAPFAQPTQERATEVLKQRARRWSAPSSTTRTRRRIARKSTRRCAAIPTSSISTATHTDVTVLLRDLYRAGYNGMRFAQSYAVTTKVLESLPHEVSEGVITVQPSADVTSPAYDLAKKRLGVAEPDSYETQATIGRASYRSRSPRPAPPPEPPFTTACARSARAAARRSTAPWKA
jgi:branched-chain amino acid transport system substrate-binding protein